MGGGRGYGRVALWKSLPASDGRRELADALARECARLIGPGGHEVAIPGQRGNANVCARLLPA